MGLVTWRRLHGSELTANVIGEETNVYTVAALHQSSGLLRRAPKAFERLDSAKAAADEMVRRQFHHTCTVESCGAWVIWSA